MTLYFIEMVESKRIKIGYTAGYAERRMSQLQTGQPERLILLGTIEGEMSDERSLHRELKQYRLGGEWFSGDVKEIVTHLISTNGPWYRCRELSINRRAMEREWESIFRTTDCHAEDCGHQYSESEIKHCVRNVRGLRKAQKKHKVKYGFELLDRRHSLFEIIREFPADLLRFSEYVTSYES